ncbi:LysM peptidoglycan-binding domain-containing protein [Rhodobacteraceae bacterium HSP-20]|uniref:LysM peptidoglycan-binding domain-containing protein n=1 Tax=Paragemmobacter amnigenus TaxID=2852097 RepID=A0ABS6J7L9_9RHOB|nr:LysM peptidoglycan-binding domain-containing protein [Rhodobacter amnigenus]MBU9699502.1 LysM peptidoglycan-binding domain-containing protein [Rhodobacter amnigenus]MBV4390729.1 LysM peptidoglycan-binding domain-containing protein [Rhodobacter amnigenus]
MKPWAEMTAGARGGVFGVVAAVIAALLYGAWSVRGTAPQTEVTGEVTPTGSGAATEGTAGGSADEGAEAAPEGAVEEGAADEAAADDAAAEAEAAEAVSAEEAAASGEAAADGAAEAVVAGEAAGDGAVDDGAADDGAAAAEPAALPSAVAPSFDLVRVERDGSALVAGKAEPSTMLSLRVTGQEIAAVPADGAGNFVAMFNLAPSNAPRVLSMVMKRDDGTEVPSGASVVIAPTVAPVAVAVAEGGAEPAPEAAAAPAALLVTDDGAKVLQSAAELPAELVANVTIDAITYTPEGAVQLSGRGTAERAVRVYLDNAPVADAAISAAGDWAVTLGEVAAGIYTLRVDQLDEGGKVTSRFETPFKRETVEALAAASAGAEPEAGAAVAEEAGAATAQGGSDTAGTVEAAGEGSGEAAAEANAEAAPPATITVQPGFTLWKIATENLGDGILYVQVFEANKDQIRDPDLIYPGQVFTIPSGE